MNKGLRTALFGAASTAVLLAACGDEAEETQQENGNGGDQSDEAEETDFPEGSVDIIVPYAAGGGTDAVARSFADIAEEELGETVSVLNREGGGGAVGMQEGAAADPDGHTVTMVTVELLTLPHSGLAQFTHEDFIPVSLLNEDAAAITVPADSEWETIDDFIEASQNESGIQIGNSGTGAIWHLAAAALEQEIDSQYNHVPFDGAAPAITALLGGHIDAVTVSAAEVSSQVEAGELEILAVMAEERLDAYPDVPTLEESGVDLSIGTWRGMAVPEGTPEGTVNALEEAFAAAAEDERFIETLEDLDLGYRYEDPQGFRDLLEEQDALFGELIPTLDLE
ncbi:ABC transporter substrate-binding protein [Alteribacter lacisalsi]|uniref:ABC transporter substrate-binding protein n=1 Tax=Alteribacter lacisalsi TaxID=2045244 RepID=A0A2W0HQR0_9BACI|nr:tripartite tricarboxylate transporter substrate binding protein [Alteribacter lacisalsi]PYZ95918.1 ABC transporter substrate-binding protein [Alteribacter lacisalsi]